MPKVSVILTSYNHAEYIKYAIESVLNQTYTDYELIIWDDCSTDKSWEIINSYKDPRIKAYRSEKNMWCGYINKTLDLASGKYIAIHHSDDIWEPEKLEKQVRFLDSHPKHGAVFSLAEIIDDNGAPFANTDHFYCSIFNKENRSRHQWLNFFFYNCNCICHPSILIRKECYETVGYYDSRLAQLPDFDMWVRLCMKYEIHIIHENLIKFRLHENRSNESDNPEAPYRHIFEYIKILNNFLNIRGKEEIIKIFPEISSIINEKHLADSDIIRYAVAQLALKTAKNAHHVFALDTLYCLLGQQKIAEKLERIAGFTYRDFKVLTGESEIRALETLIREKDIRIVTLEETIKEQTARISALDRIILEKDVEVSAIKDSLKQIESSPSNKIGSMITAPYTAVIDSFEYLFVNIKDSYIFNVNRLSNFPKALGFRGYLDNPDIGAIHPKICSGWFASKNPLYKVELFIGDKKITELERTIKRSDVDSATRGYDNIIKKGFEYYIPESTSFGLRNKERTLFVRFYIDEKHYIDKFHTKIRL